MPDRAWREYKNILRTPSLVPDEPKRFALGAVEFLIVLLMIGNGVVSSISWYMASEIRNTQIEIQHQQDDIKVVVAAICSPSSKWVIPEPCLSDEVQQRLRELPK